MGARRFVVLTLVISALGGAGAWAAPVPSPTSAVTTYLANGTALPVTPVSATWSGGTPGCAGALEASGPVASGTTTVVTGDFLSRAFRPRTGNLADLSGFMGGRRLVQPLPETFVMSIRLRAVGHRWTPWFTLSMSTQPATPPDPLFTVSAGAGIGIAEAPPRPGHRLPLQQIELKLRDEITSTGSADDVFRVRVGC